MRPSKMERLALSQQQPGLRRPSNLLPSTSVYVKWALYTCQRRTGMQYSGKKNPKNNQLSLLMLIARSRVLKSSRSFPSTGQV